MGADEEEIKTGVDRLIKLLYERKKISLEEASKLLSIPKERLEDWARVLEDEGIVKVDYGLTKTYINWAAGEKTQPASGFGSEIPTVSTEAEISRLLARVQIKGEQIKTLEQDYLEIYKSLDPKMLDASANIERLKKLAAARDDAYLRYSRRLEEIRGSLDGIAKSVGATGEQVDSLREKYRKTEEGMEKIRGEYSEYEKISGRIAQLEKKTQEEASGLLEVIGAARKALSAPDEAQVHMEKLEKTSRELEKLKEELGAHVKHLSDMHLEISRDNGAKAVIEKTMQKVDAGAGKIKEELLALEEKARSFGDSAKETLGHIRVQKEELEAILGAEARIRGLFLEAKSANRLVKETEAHMAHISASQEEINEQVRQIKEALSLLPSYAARKKKISDAISELSRFQKEIEADVARAHEISQDIKSSAQKREISEVEAEKKRISSQVLKQFSQVEKLKSEYLSLFDEMSKTLSSLDLQIKEQQATLDGQMKKMGIVVSKMGDFGSRKNEVKNVLDSLTSLRKEQTKLEGKISALAKKMELQKQEPVPSPKTEEKIREEFALSAEEAARFEEKRQKLRNMIDKLWQDNKPPHT